MNMVDCRGIAFFYFKLFLPLQQNVSFNAKSAEVSFCVHILLSTSTYMERTCLLMILQLLIANDLINLILIVNFLLISLIIIDASTLSVYKVGQVNFEGETWDLGLKGSKLNLQCRCVQNLQKNVVLDHFSNPHCCWLSLSGFLLA